MSRKRQSSVRWSKDGHIAEAGLIQLYAALQESVVPVYDMDADTGTHDPRRKPTSLRAGSLPHPDDVRATLKVALRILERERSKRSAIRILRLALRRHLNWDIELDQAFGYRRVSRGASLNPRDREINVACAVFEQRFIKGRRTDTAGYEAGKGFGISKTAALLSFDRYAGEALEIFKHKRIQSGRRQLWSKFEAQRLKRYYERKQIERAAFINGPPEGTPTVRPDKKTN